MHMISKSVIARYPLRWSALLLLGSLAINACLPAAEPATMIPAPAVDEPVGASATPETAVLAGGCFWGVQGVFQHVKGVIQATSGYAGGASDTANYDEVSTGSTGHAESVRITYDPKQISYGGLLQIYFSVAHDPTEVNRQGPDSGTQYRSAVFPRDAMQQKIATAYIAQLDQAKVFGALIATHVEMGQSFHAAEAYHQYQTLVALRPPASIEEKNKVLFESLQTGRDYAERPEFYIPYNAQTATKVLERAREATALLTPYPHHRPWLEAYARAHKRSLSDVRYLPVMAREDWVAIVTPHGQIAQFLKGDGFL